MPERPSNTKFTGMVDGLNMHGKAGRGRLRLPVWLGVPLHARETAFRRRARFRRLPGPAVVFFFSLTAGSSNLAAQIQTPPDLSGNYIRGDFVGLGEIGQLIDGEFLTNEGQRRRDEYDYQIDDPVYACVPASWTRVWWNPNVVVQIGQDADHVRLRYEFMDLDRVIPLAAEGRPRDAVGIDGLPTLGRSVAWYDGDTLVIDTSDYERGYVATMADWAGLAQSRRMRTIERLRRGADGLTIEITHIDPVVFRRPFVVTFHYVATDYELLDYGCLPEEASIVTPD